MTACQAIAGAGAVRSILGAVDCNTQGFAQRGYEALTGAASPFQAALTILLTLYVAAIGYRMLFAPDGARLSDAPRMALKIGAIIALVTSWSLFQTLVFDVAAKAPIEIARLISPPGDDGLGRGADPVGRLQVAYDQLSIEAQRFDKAAGPATAANAGQAAAAARTLAAASGAVLMANAGLIAVGKIAVAVLTAVGPIFVALFLFSQTRGLFVGWARALIAAALISVTAWVLAILMVNVLDPWLAALARQRLDKVLDPETAVTAASIVLVFAAGQVALALSAGTVALGLRLPGARPAAATTNGRLDAASEPLPAELISRPAQLAEQLRRLGAEPARASRTAAALAEPSRAGRGPRAEGPDHQAPHIGELYRRPAIRNREAAA